MSTKPVIEEVSEFEEEESGFYLMARKVMLASIGAVALAQEELEEFINKLVERGEIAEKDGKQLVGEIMERRKSYQKKTKGELNKQIEQIMDRMDVPTKADIDSLTKKIEALSKKIDELNKD